MKPIIKPTVPTVKIAKQGNTNPIQDKPAACLVFQEGWEGTVGNLIAKIVLKKPTQKYLLPLPVQPVLLAKETWEDRLPVEIVQQERK